MTFFEWLGRVIMLVLAGMITLSIISALAAISSSTVPQPLGRERAAAPTPPPRQEPPPEPQSKRAAPEANKTSGAARHVTIAPAPPEPVDPARWLEAITYALLALSGLAALGCLLLWRLLHQQRRIADALSAAPPPSFAPPSGAWPGG